MHYTIKLAVLAAAVTASPYPQAVTSKIAPPGAPPAGCVPSFDGKFGLRILSAPWPEATHNKRANQEASVVAQFTNGQSVAPTLSISSDSPMTVPTLTICEVGDPGCPPREAATLSVDSNSPMTVPTLTICEVGDPGCPPQGAAHTHGPDARSIRLVTQVRDGQPQDPPDTTVTETKSTETETESTETETISTETETASTETEIASTETETASTETETASTETETASTETETASTETGTASTETETASTETETSSTETETVSTVTEVVSELGDGQPHGATDKSNHPSITPTPQFYRRSDGNPVQPTQSSDVQSSDGHPVAPEPFHAHRFLERAIEVSELQTMNQTSLGTEQCSAEMLILSLGGTVMKDGHARTAYIASNFQFQFDDPPQAGALTTAGYTVCSLDDHTQVLALGPSKTFWRCRSGDFYNLYDRNWAAQCEPIYMQVVKLNGCK